MLKFSNNRIDINVSGKINLYQSESAVGKSYLPKVLKNYGIDWVVCDSKDSYCLLRKHLEEGKVPNGLSTIYFLDRYDLFGDIEIIKKLFLIDGITVFVDCKDTNKIYDRSIYVNSVIIERLSGMRFKVYDDNTD